jgi:hypothetical protein
MKYALVIALAAILIGASACGGDPYQAPPVGNGYKASNTPPGTTTPGKKEPTGPSYSKEYDPEAKAAFKAWDAWAGDKTPENFAKVGTHLYNAMRYKILTDRHGHPISGFHRANELGRLFTDWKKTFQTGDWENDPDYKAAKAAYNEVQQ